MDKPTHRKRRKVSSPSSDSRKITEFFGKPKSLDITVVKATKKKKKTLEKSWSFEEYGLALPSFEDILEKQKEYEEYKAMLQKFDSFDDDDDLVEEVVPDVGLKEPEQDSFKMLDCRHLSKDSLSEAFLKYRHVLSEISQGKRFSRRDRSYHNGSKTEDLKCSTSCVVFTFEQKDHLLNMMRIEFESEKTTYFFQVLLPELCLLIFMDEHKMSRHQAVEYLDRRPVDF